MLFRSDGSLNVLLNLDRIIHLDLHFSNDDYNFYLYFIVDECHLERLFFNCRFRRLIFAFLWKIFRNRTDVHFAAWNPTQQSDSDPLICSLTKICTDIWPYIFRNLFVCSFLRDVFFISYFVTICY